MSWNIPKSKETSSIESDPRLNLKESKRNMGKSWEDIDYTLQYFLFLISLQFMSSFDFILYVPVTIVQLNRDGSSWVEPVLSSDKCVLLKDHNTL